MQSRSKRWLGSSVYQKFELLRKCHSIWSWTKLPSSSRHHMQAVLFTKWHQNMFFVSPRKRVVTGCERYFWIIFWASERSILHFYCSFSVFQTLVSWRERKMCLNCYLSVYLLPFFHNSTARMLFHDGRNLNMTRSILFFNIEGEQMHCFVIIKAWHNDLDKLLQRGAQGGAILHESQTA